MEDTLHVMTLEMRAGFAESRAGMAESRAGMADLRSEMADLRSDLTSRLDTLFAALAEFRAEYQAHTHGEA